MNVETKGRSAMRKAVVDVLGRRGSAVIGDGLMGALRLAGWDLHQPNESQEFLLVKRDDNGKSFANPSLLVDDRLLRGEAHPNGVLFRLVPKATA